MLAIGSELELVIEKPAVGGRMIARHDGQVVLVSGAIPGERIAARVDRISRGVAYASTHEVFEPHTDRRAAAHDPACGGNLFAHIAYPRQLTLKGEIIGDAFARIAHIQLDRLVPVLGSPEEGYRMRARLHVRGARFGFFREGTQELCDPAASGQLLPDTGRVLGRVAAEMQAASLRGATSIELAENIPADQRVLHFELDHDSRPSLLSVLARIPGVTGISYEVAGGRVGVVAGNPFVADPVERIAPGVQPRDAAIVLRRQPRAFFQGNRFLLPQLVARVLTQIGPGDVLDLYAGVGLFAVTLAAGGRDRITAVEADRAAAIDLRANAAELGGAVQVEQRPVEAYLRTRAADPPQNLILDPARTGLSREAMSGVIDCRAPRIVYLSCDVATLARDIRRLVDAGYRLEHVEAFDLFPNTAHIETLAVLQRA